MTVENCTDVEVIGWLYQFYISEKKDDVFVALKKGKKITPENIPAATQLFTPHWIVRYLVENSLGRLWMLNRPDSRLVEQMDYYIRPEEPETDFLKISNPEEIKVCDPACGSGHMLTYAFDLLYAIYEEQGYQATDITRLILKHNLYGVEIDQRAGALAAFALVMKARQKDRRFFSRKPLDESSATAIQNPNVCVLENISIDPEDLSAYMDKVGRDLFSGGVQGVVNQWEEADNFGSLIRPLVTDVSDVLELLRERQMGEDLFLAGVHQKVLKALLHADYLSPRYHVVVANPPYMGQKGMNADLKEHLRSRFADVSTDLFSSFILRNMELCVCGGQLGFMSPFVWMFISSFEDLRRHLLNRATIVSLVQLEYSGFDGATVPVCTFTIENKSNPSYRGAFIRLSDFKGSENQGPRTLEAIRNQSCGWFFRSEGRHFSQIPGAPIAYWLTDTFRGIFSQEKSISESSVEPATGLQTGDNSRFIRCWFEVSQKRRGTKWFPLNDGGDVRKWYGNFISYIDWENDGAEMRQHKSAVIRNSQYYFKEGATWNRISSAFFAVRYLPEGFIFDQAGDSLFASTPTQLKTVIGFLNSRIGFNIMKVLCPTLNATAGNLNSFPYPAKAMQHAENISTTVGELIAIEKRDWDSFELSWDFSSPELLQYHNNDKSLAKAYGQLRGLWNSERSRVKHLEEQNNSLFLRTYGLERELPISVDDQDITLLSNPVYRYGSEKSESELEALLLADTMREFISYAVGCMFGRYSLDKSGLILASQGETVADYRKQISEPIFAPDEDNVIPILEGEWFSDDISQRFKDFLKVTFGIEHYDQNLEFLENALYSDNATAKKRKTIRDYFLKEFYDHHLKMYKKRPIYWLFSSPKGTFNALSYLQRYRSETVGKVLECLRDFRDKLSSHAEHRQGIADSASESKAEKTLAVKEVATIKKQLKELEDYEKTLFEVAAKKISIDLDDGVKHNYPLFGSVLRKIPGLAAKED